MYSCFFWEESWWHILQWSKSCSSCVFLIHSCGQGTTTDHICWANSAADQQAPPHVYTGQVTSLRSAKWNASFSCLIGQNILLELQCYLYINNSILHCWVESVSPPFLKLEWWEKSDIGCSSRLLYQFRGQQFHMWYIITNVNYCMSKRSM